MAGHLLPRVQWLYLKLLLLMPWLLLGLRLLLLATLPRLPPIGLYPLYGLHEGADIRSAEASHFEAVHQHLQAPHSEAGLLHGLVRQRRVATLLIHQRGKHTTVLDDCSQLA